MKKYLIFIIPLFIWGCAKKYNDVVDPQSVNYQITNVTSFSDTTFKTGDSVFTFSISLSSSKGVNSLSFDVVDPDNNILNSSPVTLFDDGKSIHGDSIANDNTFSNRYPFSQSFVNGKYSIKYYIADDNGTELAAVHNFNYNNNQADFAPVISNLIAPDSATQQQSTAVILNVSVAVFDSNGHADIQTVFYNSYLPGGTPSAQNPILMYDDGDLNHGDLVANDGIYSAIVQLPSANTPPPVPKGTFRWEFQAKDREGKLSNIIIHNIVIK